MHFRGLVEEVGLIQCFEVVPTSRDKWHLKDFSFQDSMIVYIKSGHFMAAKDCIEGIPRELKKYEERYTGMIPYVYVLLMGVAAPVLIVGEYGKDLPKPEPKPEPVESAAKIIKLTLISKEDVKPPTPLFDYIEMELGDGADACMSHFVPGSWYVFSGFDKPLFNDTFCVRMVSIGRRTITIRAPLEKSGEAYWLPWLSGNEIVICKAVPPKPEPKPDPEPEPTENTVKIVRVHVEKEGAGKDFVWKHEVEVEKEIPGLKEDMELLFKGFFQPEWNKKNVVQSVISDKVFRIDPVLDPYENNQPYDPVDLDGKEVVVLDDK